MDNYFSELLQISLGTRDTLSRVPSDVVWHGLMEEAQRQAVVGVLLDGIERLPAAQHPSKLLLLQWVGLAQLTEATYQLHCERVRELTRRFHSAGFKCCVLKGIGTARLYPAPARRQCGDIDMWVDGRRKDVMAWLGTHCGTGLVTWHHIEARFFRDVEVEVHVHPAWMYNPFCNRRLQRFFDKNKEIQMAEHAEGFGYPMAMFDAVFSLVHSYHHLLEEGVGMRHVVDYYYVLKYLHAHCPGSFRHTSVFLHRIGLGKFAAAMMWVLRETCGASPEMMLCTPNEKEGRFLADEIVRGGNFGQMRQDGLSRNTVRRWLLMLRHYPMEAIWMVPWKVWHWGWRMFNR